MPDLRGMTLAEAQAKPGPIGLVGVPVEVVRPDQPLGVVVDQSLPHGSQARRGQRITIHINTEEDAEPVAPEPSWYTATVTYTVPRGGWFARPVRIDVIGREGVRSTEFPRQENYVDGKPPRFQAGTTIRQPIRFQEELTVEIFVDDSKVRSIYYSAEEAPVVTDYGDASNGGT